MSFHFLKGTSYGAYEDTAPDTGQGRILVDYGATISTSAASTHALALSAAPWLVTVNGSISASGGDAIVLNNTAEVISNVIIGSKATILSDYDFGVGINAVHGANITNAGSVSGSLAGIAQTGDGDFRIVNAKSGSIGGLVYGVDVEGLGTHRILNAGEISGSIRSLSGDEKVTNFGSVDGLVELGDGNDTFTNFKKVGGVVKNGFVSGTIFLGGGDDTFNGGKHFEIVTDEDGRDIVRLGGGNDGWNAHFSTADGADVVDGGKGIDTYDGANLGAHGINLNLDSKDHFNFKANFADDFDTATPGETIRNFENAYGTDAGDTLFGSGNANILSGGQGDDALAGFGGKDQLYGGSGEDKFAFFSLKDSGPTQAARDVIHDFEQGADVIYLVEINAKLGGIIDYIGLNLGFSGQAGELRTVTAGDDTILQLDANGDKKADFSVQLDGQHALTETDFILTI